jgi:hypothetical protein
MGKTDSMNKRRPGVHLKKIISESERKINDESENIGMGAVK